MTLLTASVLLAAAGPAAAQPPVPAAVSNEIAVIGKRLKDWRGRVNKKGDAFVCTTKKTSGDTAIDAIRCNAMRWCAGQLDGEMQAILTSTDGKADRKARMSAMGPKMAECAAQYEEASVERLAWERAQG